MNSSSLIDPSVFIQNSTTMTIVEPWFIPLDIFLIICCFLIVIMCAVLLLIMILDKTCHTVPMMLIANTYVSGLITGCALLSLAMFTFQNDLKRIQYQDSQCILRVYFAYSSGAAGNFSYLIQALYRYFIVIYPTRLLFQSFRFQILIIFSSWLFCFVFPFAFIFDGQIIYNVDNQICQPSISFSFTIIYLSFCTFACPISLIMFIYWKLIQHVREMGKNVTGTNTLIRAQRELKMVRRIVIIITFLVIVCFPFTVILFMGFFNHAPKYNYRFFSVFVDFSSVMNGILLFQFTDPFKEAVMKIIKWRPNRIGV